MPTKNPAPPAPASGAEQASDEGSDGEDGAPETVTMRSGKDAARRKEEEAKKAIEAYGFRPNRQYRTDNNSTGKRELRDKSGNDGRPFLKSKKRMRKNGEKYTPISSPPLAMISQMKTGWSQTTIPAQHQNRLLPSCPNHSLKEYRIVLPPQLAAIARPVTARRMSTQRSTRGTKTSVATYRYRRRIGSATGRSVWPKRRRWSSRKGPSASRC